MNTKFVLAFQQGLNAHKQGKLKEAAFLYKKVLLTEPRHGDALHNLGAIEFARGNIVEAIETFEAAINCGVKNDQFWLSYINALIAQNRSKDAERAFKRAKRKGVSKSTSRALKSLLLGKPQTRGNDQNNFEKLDSDELSQCFSNGQLEKAEKKALQFIEKYPNNSFGWKVLGATLSRTSRLAEAVEAYRRSTQISPEDSEAHNNLGNALIESEKLEEAEASLRRALQLNPEYPEALNNLGIVFLKTGRLEQSERSLRLAIANKHNYVNAVINLSNSLGKMGRLDEAENTLRDVVINNSNSAEVNYNLGTLLCARGKLKDAEIFLRQAVTLQPKHFRALNNLGAALHQLEENEEALAILLEARRIKPDFFSTHNNLGAVFLELARLEEAAKSLNQALALGDDSADPLVSLGGVYKKLGKLSEAENFLRQAISIDPRHVIAFKNLGGLLIDLRRLDEAEAILRQGLSLNWTATALNYGLGIVLQEKGKLEEALSCFENEVRLAPESSEARNALGAILRDLGRLDDARETLLEAVTIDPKCATAFNNLGVMAQELGELDKSYQLYARAVELQPDFASAHRNLALLKTFSKEDEQLRVMLEIDNDASTSNCDGSHINFALGKAFEDLRQYEKSYEHYCKGNALRKKELRYDINNDVELCDQLRATFVKLGKCSASASDFEASLIPVFIVGMPRSGTTLIEQMVSSHSGVTGAGELPFAWDLGSQLARGLVDGNYESVNDFRNQYLEKLQLASNGRGVVIDKMPHNFLLLGLLKVALPEAKFVHVKRDPAAVCWANFKTYFVSRNDILGYCYSLDDTVKYFHLYENLMKFWLESFGDSIYEVNYEDLTVNQEVETRRLIANLELEWEDDCLAPQNNTRRVMTASSAQVRKPVYQGSSEKWRNFEPFLGGKLFFDAGAYRNSADLGC